MNIFSFRNEQWFVYEYVLAELEIFMKGKKLKKVIIILYWDLQMYTCDPDTFFWLLSTFMNY